MKEPYSLLIIFVNYNSSSLTKFFISRYNIPPLSEVITEKLLFDIIIMFELIAQINPPFKDLISLTELS